MEIILKAIHSEGSDSPIGRILAPYVEVPWFYSTTSLLVFESCAVY